MTCTAVRNWQCFTLISLASLVLAFGLDFAPVHAASITVNATCSLADAITAANSDTATGGCIAGSGADTITLTQDISLTSGLPTITSEVTIDGAYHTISAPPEIRPLTLSGTVHLTRLRMRKTSTSVIYRWMGGLIWNDGTLSISKSSFFNGFAYNGGGIYNLGTLTVERSFFRGNLARNYGGAIANQGAATIFNSTFSENDARIGGAIGTSRSDIFGEDGHGPGEVTITNVTMYGNRADTYASAVFNEHGSATVINSIMAGTMYVQDCSVPQVMNTINSYSQSGDFCQASFTSADGPIMLGELVEPTDGSPAYYPVLHGSPALGNGHSDYCPATDQLGNARPNPAGENCDLGAIEANPVAPTDTPIPTATNSPTNTVSPTITLTPSYHADSDGHI